MPNNFQDLVAKLSRIDLFGTAGEALYPGERSSKP
jgi:hypothetical protein